MAKLPNDNVLHQMEQQLDSISANAAAPPENIASGLSNALTLAYRYANDLADYVKENRGANPVPSTARFQQLLVRARDLAEDFDSRLDHEIATHHGLMLTALAHLTHNSSDAISKNLTRALEACSAVFRRLAWLPISPPLPDTKLAFPLLKTLVNAESLRRDAKFFPKTAFESWKNESGSAEDLALRQTKTVEELVGLLAWERQARRRGAAFEALEDWAQQPASDLPSKQERKGHSDEQLRLIERIRAGLSMRSSTAGSIEALWRMFTPQSTFATVFRYAMVAIPAFTLAYFGQEWTEIARSHSQRVLVATVLVLLTLLGFVIYWLQRARNDAVTPGLLSLAATVGILVAGAVFSVYVVKRSEPEFACAGLTEQSDCHKNYRVLPSQGEFTALYRTSDDAEGPSYLVVRTADVLLSRDGHVVVAKHKDKPKDDIQVKPSQAAAPVYNITLPSPAQQNNANALAPVVENLAAIAKEIAAQSGHRQAAAPLPPELAAQLGQLAVSVKDIDAAMENALEDKQRYLDPGLVRFCYEEIKRERRLWDRWADSWKGRPGNVSALITCVNNFKAVADGVEAAVASGPPPSAAQQPVPISGQ